MNARGSKCVHVIFGHSAAATLRGALASIGRDDVVLNFWGTYNAGPTGATLNERAKWIADSLYCLRDGADFELRYKSENSETLKSIRSINDRLVVWRSAYVGRELCDFLQFNRLADEGANLHLIDVGERQIALLRLKNRPEEADILASGAMSAEFFLSLLDSEELISPDERSRLQKLWSAVADENAPLRILLEGELVSAELDYFDERLLETVPQENINAARVVGSYMGNFDCFGRWTQGLSDLFWFARLGALADKGLIEWIGDDGAPMRAVTVRRLQ